MSETSRAKALRAIAEDRVCVIRAAPQGIALHVTSSKPNPETLQRATYRTYVYLDAEQVRVIRSCSCPAPARCYHMQVAELLWRPAPEEVSAR